MKDKELRKLLGIQEHIFGIVFDKDSPIKKLREEITKIHDYLGVTTDWAHNLFPPLVKIKKNNKAVKVK